MLLACTFIYSVSFKLSCAVFNTSLVTSATNTIYGDTILDITGFE